MPHEESALAPILDLPYRLLFLDGSRRIVLINDYLAPSAACSASSRATTLFPASDARVGTRGIVSGDLIHRAQRETPFLWKPAMP